jgi:hypothetical protein
MQNYLIALALSALPAIGNFAGGNCNYQVAFVN